MAGMFDVPLVGLHSLKLACFRYFASVAKEQTRLKSWRGPQLGWIKIPFLFLLHLSPYPTIVPPLFYLPSLFLFPLPVQYAYGLGGIDGLPSEKNEGTKYTWSPVSPKLEGTRGASHGGVT